MVEQTSKHLLLRYRDGESRAAAEIFDRYVQRLVLLTRRRISPKLSRRIDPEDVVQSAYRSFFVHAREGEFALERAGDLWRLLARITLNKLHGQVERHTAARRAMEREEDLGGDLGEATHAPEPTPAEVAGIKEQLTLTMQGLSHAQREAFELRLTGKSIEEIANTLGRSQRTARRFLDQVRVCLEQRLHDDRVAFNHGVTARQDNSDVGTT